MKKILIVTDTWEPEINGLVTSLVNLKKKLEANDYRVVIVSPRLFQGISIFFRPELKFSLFRRKKMQKIFADEKPDYIHIATESSLGIAARRICIENKLQFTTSYHTNFPNYVKILTGAFFNIAYSYLRWFHSAAARTMVTNENMRSILQSHDFKNLVIWPIGVDTEFFKKNPEAKLPEGVSHPVFVYFGRVAPEKSTEDFFKCDLLGTKIVVGDGPNVPEFKKIYPEIKFYGYKTGQELIDLLSICDAYVFPSRTETFGLSVIEAMACAIPVSAYNVTGPKDIITDGLDGYLGTTIKELENNAVKALQLNPENCRKKAMTYTWQVSMEEFIKHM